MDFLMNHIEEDVKLFTEALDAAFGVLKSGKIVFNDMYAEEDNTKEMLMRELNGTWSSPYETLRAYSLEDSRRILKSAISGAVELMKTNTFKNHID